MPWDYWSADGEAEARRRSKWINALEGIIARFHRNTRWRYTFTPRVEASHNPDGRKTRPDMLAKPRSGSWPPRATCRRYHWRVGTLDEDAATAK